MNKISVGHIVNINSMFLTISFVLDGCSYSNMNLFSFMWLELFYLFTGNHMESHFVAEKHEDLLSK